MDWLSRLLDLVPVAGRLDIRCAFGAPWRVDHAPAEPGEVQYHVIAAGMAVLDDPSGHAALHLETGDVLILPGGGAHLLHDGGGAAASPVTSRAGINLTIHENAGVGQRLDMLCGSFLLSVPHIRLLRGYLPPHLVVRGKDSGVQLASLIELMRREAAAERLGGRAVLNAFSSALFTIALRSAGEATDAPAGLLALARHPRLAPALTAIFNQPAYPWSLPALADLCHMSRATFARHFQESLGRTAADLLTDIRMTLAANELRKPSVSARAVAEIAGYQSEAAFQRVFKQRLGVTPAQWRRAARAQDVEPGRRA
jgi:AraC family transcriptional activator of mtrCDE